MRDVFDKWMGDTKGTPWVVKDIRHDVEGHVLSQSLMGEQLPALAAVTYEETVTVVLWAAGEHSAVPQEIHREYFSEEGFRLTRRSHDLNYYAQERITTCELTYTVYKEHH